LGVGNAKGEKNELMFRHGINYNDLPEQFRKGSVLFWGSNKEIAIEHMDIVKDSFGKTTLKFQADHNVHLATGLGFVLAACRLRSSTKGMRSVVLWYSFAEFRVF